MLVGNKTRSKHVWTGTQVNLNLKKLLPNLQMQSGTLAKSLGQKTKNTEVWEETTNLKRRLLWSSFWLKPNELTVLSR